MGPVRLNAFTVDVEDYFQVSAFARQVDPRTWDQYESRVEPNTDRILRILEKRGTRGTFFILGWVAERFPGLVKRIDAAGHEIGSHSYWHRLVYDLNPDEFQSDLERSCDVLEQLIGKKVRLFRAASFSVVERSLWALQILAERGIELDSSIFPVRHDPDQPRMRGKLVSRMRHYVNLAGTARKLDSLLERFQFGTLSETLRGEADRGAAGAVVDIARISRG